jgi:hypothetical protein
MHSHQSTRVQVLRPKQIFGAMTQALSSWLGEEEIENWLGAVDTLPICSTLFLEVHPASIQPRCDIVISVVASDGSLSAFLQNPAVGTSSIWRKTIATLKKWEQQLRSKKGALRTHCFMMWLEFDLCVRQKSLGDPAIFIALTPQADIGELAEQLNDYADFQSALLNLKYASLKNSPLLQSFMRTNSLALGHIGYMGSRQKADQLLPLRSCWRCNDIAHFQQLLMFAGISFDRPILLEQLGWLEDIAIYINSFMLDLDNHTDFMPDFSLELNVYNPRANSPTERESVLLQAIVDCGFMSIDQKQKLLIFSGHYFLESEQTFDCLLHHIKLRCSGSKIQEIKCYWLISV